MATTMSVPIGGLQAPAEDDTMEISSQTGQQDDIDIDIDTFDVQYTDDEHMLEDHPNLPTDDAMVEEVFYEEPRDEDAMQEELHLEVQDQDEDLPDLSEEEFDMHENAIQEIEMPTGATGPQDEPQDFTQIEYSHQQDATVVNYDQTDEEFVRQDEIQELQEASADPAVPINNDHVPTEMPLQSIIEREPASDQQATTPAAEEHDAAQNTGHIQTALEVQTFTTEDAQYDDVVTAPEVQRLTESYDEARQPTALTDSRAATDELQSEASPLTLETSLAGNGKHPRTPTLTGLHPMQISFAGYTWSLFKAGHEDYLLGDDNWASRSLNDLIGKCKKKIGDKLGKGVVDESQLFELVFPISVSVLEDSRSSFGTSLLEFLEVFLHLHENDGMDAPALQLRLECADRFDSPFKQLQQAVSEGKGFQALMSDVQASFSMDSWRTQYEHVRPDQGPDEEDGEHQSQHEQEEEVQEEFYEGEAYDAEDDQYYQQQDEASADHLDAADYDTTAEAHGSKDDNAVQQMEEHDAEQNTYDEATYQDEEQELQSYYQEETNEDNQPFADHAEYQDEGPENILAAVQPNQTVDTELFQEDDGGTLTGEGQDEGKEVQGNFLSDGSSTVRGDDEATELNGEYKKPRDFSDYPEEDLIDWDSESTEELLEDLRPALVDDTGAFQDDGVNARLYGEGDTDGQETFESHSEHNGNRVLDHEQSSVNAGTKMTVPIGDLVTGVEDDANNRSGVEGIYTGQDPFEDGDSVDYAQEEDGEGGAHDTAVENLSDETAANASKAGGDLSDQGAQPEAGNDEAAKDNADQEDFIDFDDDTPAQHEARKAQAALAAATPPSAGKRSYEYLTGEDDLYDEEPEPKKVRSS